MLVLVRFFIEFRGWTGRGSGGGLLCIRGCPGFCGEPGQRLAMRLWRCRLGDRFRVAYIKIDGRRCIKVGLRRLFRLIEASRRRTEVIDHAPLVAETRRLEALNGANGLVAVEGARSCRLPPHNRKRSRRPSKKPPGPARNRISASVISRSRPRGRNPSAAALR